MVQISSQLIAEVIAAFRGTALETSTGREFRRASRLGLNARVPVVVATGDSRGRTFTSLTRDISLTGLGMLQSVPLEQDQQFIVTLPTLKQPIHVLCITAHCRELADSIYAVGARFVRIVQTAAEEQHPAADVIPAGSEQPVTSHSS